MADPSRRRRSERGESLLEVVVAIFLLATIGVAAYGALSTSAVSSAEQRRSAQGETLLRSAAEWVQNPDLDYAPRSGCPGVSPYTLPAVPASTSGFTVSVSKVEFWTGASTSPVVTLTAGFTSTCPTAAGDDRGLQRITLTVSGPSSFSDTITVIKRRT